MKHLEGKTAIVVGASRGFGRTIVCALAGEGATVWAVARDAASLDHLSHEVAGVHTLAADVRVPDTAPRVLRAARPQILVLNAAYAAQQGISERAFLAALGRRSCRNILAARSPSSPTQCSAPHAALVSPARK